MDRSLITCRLSERYPEMERFVSPAGADSRALALHSLREWRRRCGLLERSNVSYRRRALIRRRSHPTRFASGTWLTAHSATWLAAHFAIIAFIRRSISSGATSSVWVAIVHMCPAGSVSVPLRSP